MTIASNLINDYSSRRSNSENGMLECISGVHEFRNFTGTIFSKRKNRQERLHNKITFNETHLSERIIQDYRFSSILTEFFPVNILDYLTLHFKELEYNKCRFRGNILSLRLHLYLCGVSLILLKQGIFIPNSTYEVIGKYFNVEINKQKFYYFYILFKQKLLSFWEKYPYNKEINFINAIKYALESKNKNGHSKESVVKINERSIEMARKILKSQKFKTLKTVSFDPTAKGIVSLAYSEITGYKAIPFEEKRDKTRRLIQTKKSIVKKWLNMR